MDLGKELFKIKGTNLENSETRDVLKRTRADCCTILSHEVTEVSSVNDFSLIRLFGWKYYRTGLN